MATADLHGNGLDEKALRVSSLTGRVETSKWKDEVYVLAPQPNCQVFVRKKRPPTAGARTASVAISWKGCPKQRAKPGDIPVRVTDVVPFVPAAA